MKDVTRTTGPLGSRDGCNIIKKVPSRPEVAAARKCNLTLIIQENPLPDLYCLHHCCVYCVYEFQAVSDVSFSDCFIWMSPEAIKTILYFTIKNQQYVTLYLTCSIQNRGSALLTWSGGNKLYLYLCSKSFLCSKSNSSGLQIWLGLKGDWQ